MGRTRALAVVAVFLSVASSWAQPQVVVSLPPYVDLLQRVAGPDAEVTALLPAGATPHDFEPSPRDARRLHGADLIVLNGGIDTWLEDLVDAAGGEAVTLTVMEALGIGAPPVAEADPEGHEAHDHGSLGANPHVWLDPRLMHGLAPALADALANVDPAGADGYRARADVLQDDLDALHADLRALLEPVAGAPFVPFHDAWSHFARRYDLDLVMEIEPFPGREPSPRRLAEAVEALRRTGAPAVFAEDQLQERAARVLAEEAEVALFTLDPLGGVEGRRTYEALLRHNAGVVREALSADAAPASGAR